MSMLGRGALALFMVSLTALVITAVSTSSLTALYLTLAIFAVCSLNWTVRQVRNGQTASLRVILTCGLGLFATGLLILGWYEWSRHEGLLLIGGIFCYLGAGWLTEWLRRAGSHLGWAGSGVLAGGGLAGVLITTLWLPRVSKSAYDVALAGLALVVLLVLPVGLNLVCEGAERALAGHPDRGRLQRRMLGLGSVLVGIVVLGMGVVTHSWVLVLVVAGTALLLMWALASDTHADIAIVLAALALLGAAPPEAGAPPATTPGTATSGLIALGDSYMAGEGANAFLTGTDEGGGDECRRAPTAYAVGAVIAPAPRFDRLAFLACSGARTYNVTPSDGDPAGLVMSGEPGTQVDQIRALNAAFRPKLAIVALGGNDAGFSAIAETCLAPGDCATPKVRALFESDSSMDSVRRSLVASYASIRAALPSTVPVVVIPYPQPLADVRKCGEIALTADERAFIRDFLVKLDATIKQAAQQAGFYYLDSMQNALAGEHRQLCDPANHHHPGINFVRLKSVSGLVTDRFDPLEWVHDSLHPNKIGQAAMLRTFISWLTRNPEIWTSPTPTAAAGPVSDMVADPPCSVSATDETNCTVEARHWVYAQLVDTWRYWLVALVGLIGIWMISVALVSLTPRGRFARLQN